MDSMTPVMWYSAKNCSHVWVRPTRTLNTGPPVKLFSDSSRTLCRLSPLCRPQMFLDSPERLSSLTRKTYNGSHTTPLGTNSRKSRLNTTTAGKYTQRPGSELSTHRTQTIHRPYTTTYHCVPTSTTSLLRVSDSTVSFNTPGTPRYPWKLVHGHV